MATKNPNKKALGKRRALQKPEVESQGGGFRGGPKRWTGRGPPPARHIPWPEIFKHHISVVEGHKKMVDMVRKHTVEGTGNHRTITGMFERASEMLWTSRQMERSFAPPPKQREQVPIGVSSDSMYPGYSPADHEYGKAAEEYGKAVAEAKRRGVEIPKHPDIEYQIGQSKGTKKNSEAQMGDVTELTEGQNDDGNGSGSGENEGSVHSPQKLNGRTKAAEVEMEETATDKVDVPPQDNEEAYFVIDTNPTPVNLHSNKSSKSKREADSKTDEGPKSKKSKKRHSGPLPSKTAKADQTEDISAKVEAKMKEKEEKRTQKEDKKKKRKRESEKGEDIVPTGTIAEASNTVAPTAVGGDSKKPEKKKKKVKDAEGGLEELPDRTSGKKRDAEGVDDDEGAKRTTKKKRKQ